MLGPVMFYFGLILTFVFAFTYWNFILCAKTVSNCCWSTQGASLDSPTSAFHLEVSILLRGSPFQCIPPGQWAFLANPHSPGWTGIFLRCDRRALRIASIWSLWETDFLGVLLSSYSKCARFSLLLHLWIHLRHCEAGEDSAVSSSWLCFSVDLPFPWRICPLFPDLLRSCGLWSACALLGSFRASCERTLLLLSSRLSPLRCPKLFLASLSPLSPPNLPFLRWLQHPFWSELESLPLGSLHCRW